MFYWLADILSEYNRVFTVFEYITFRSILSVLTSLCISLIVGPYLIRGLTKYQIGQSIRKDGPKSHLDKKGTPTMGGMLIVISILTTSILCANPLAVSSDHFQVVVIPSNKRIPCDT